MAHTIEANPLGMAHTIEANKQGSMVSERRQGTGVDTLIVPILYKDYFSSRPFCACGAIVFDLVNICAVERAARAARSFSIIPYVIYSVTSSLKTAIPA